MRNPFVKNEVDIVELLAENKYGCSEDFTKYYREMPLVLSKLTLYILTDLLENSGDSIRLPIGSIMNTMGVRSKDSIYDAIKDLEEVGVIKKKAINEYWVNPFMINITKEDYFKTKLRDLCKNDYPFLYVKYYINEK